MNKFIFPFPPSVNALYSQGPKHGQKFLSKKGKEYKQRLLKLYANDDEPLKGPLRVRIELFPPDKRDRDLDNYIKPTLDGLTYLNIIEDDRQITTLVAMKHGPSINYKLGCVLIKLKSDPLCSSKRDLEAMLRVWFEEKDFDEDEMKEFIKETKHYSAGSENKA